MRAILCPSGSQVLERRPPAAREVRRRGVRGVRGADLRPALPGHHRGTPSAQSHCVSSSVKAVLRATRADTSRLDRTMDRAVIAERLLPDSHATSLCDDPLRVYRAVRRCPPTTGRSSPACRTWSSRPAPWAPTWPTLSCRPAAGAFSGEIHSKCGPSLEGRGILPTGDGLAGWDFEIDPSEVA